MQRIALAGESLFGLVREITGDIKTFVKQEIELARAEMSEKISSYSHNAVFLLIGGFIAYAGLIVLLGGLGVLAGFGLQHLGLDPLLSNFVGLAGVGLLVMIIGGIMLLSASKGFSRESAAPEKTIETLKQLQGSHTVEKPESKEKVPLRSSDEIQKDVLATEDRISEAIGEIADRTSPTRLKRNAIQHIESHPYRWSVIALASGLLSSVYIARKLRL
jgi:hypothetical protein